MTRLVAFILIVLLVATSAPHFALARDDAANLADALAGDEHREEDIGKDFDIEKFVQHLNEKGFHEEDWSRWERDEEYAKELAELCCELFHEQDLQSLSKEFCQDLFATIGFTHELIDWVWNYLEQNCDLVGGGGPDPHLEVSNTLIGSIDVIPGTTNVVVAAQRFAAFDGDYSLTELRYSVSGSGVVEFDITAARIVEDLDQDEQWDDGEEELDADLTLLEDDTVFSFDPGAIGGSFNVTAGQSRQVLLVLDFADTVLEDRSFTTRYRGERANGTLQNRNWAGRTISIINPVDVSLTATASNPFDGQIERDRDVVIGGITLTGAGATSTVHGLVVQATGGLYEPVDLLRARVFLDTNRDGAVSGVGQPGGDEQLAEAIAYDDDATMQFEFGSPVAVSAGGNVRLLLQWTVGETAIPGVLFGARITAVMTDTVTVNASFPMDTATFTVIEQSADTDGDTESDDNSPGSGSGNSGSTEGLGDLLVGSSAATGLGCNADGRGTATPLALFTLLVLVGLVARRRQ